MSESLSPSWPPMPRAIRVRSFRCKHGMHDACREVRRCDCDCHDSAPVPAVVS